MNLNDELELLTKMKLQSLSKQICPWDKSFEVVTNLTYDWRW